MDTKKNPTQKNPLQQPNQKTTPTSTPSKQQPYSPSKGTPTQKNLAITQTLTGKIFSRSGSPLLVSLPSILLNS